MARTRRKCLIPNRSPLAAGELTRARQLQSKSPDALLFSNYSQVSEPESEILAGNFRMK